MAPHKPIRLLILSLNALLDQAWVILGGIVIAPLVPVTITPAPQAKPALQITEPSAGSIDASLIAAVYCSEANVARTFFTTDGGSGM